MTNAPSPRSLRTALAVATLAIAAFVAAVACTPQPVCDLAVDGHPELRGCSDGAIERVGTRQCSPALQCPAFSIDSCTADDDCASAVEDGRECGTVFCRDGACACDECGDDDDCASDSFCRCEGAEFSEPRQGPGTRCVVGCRTSADCKADERCLAADGFFFFQCQAESSPCHGDDDCWFPNQHCVPSAQQPTQWECRQVFVE